AAPRRRGGGVHRGVEPVRAHRFEPAVRAPLRRPQPGARSARPARRDRPLRADGLYLGVAVGGVEGAQRRAGRRGAGRARGAARLPRLPDVLQILDELVPLRALRLRHLLRSLDEARSAGDGVNEPIGILRLVDPFRATDAWVQVAPRGYRVAVEQVSWPPRAADVARIAAVAARERARIVHAHGHWANVLAVPAARAVRVRVVCTHSPGATLAESLVIRAADALMCHSREERDQCVRREAIPAGKVWVVHPGVDLSLFPAPAPDATPLLVAVGTLLARNGHLDLLEAVARVRVVVPQLRVVCAGEGPMRPALQQRIAF